jgi:acyl-coenzyme A synthetase/AMP-(fatty) acid ligase
VRECAVLALELPDRSTTLKAFVVMGEDGFDPEETRRMLQTHVKGKLLPHSYPRIVTFLPALPRTATGKIDRQALLRASASDLPQSSSRDGTAASELVPSAFPIAEPGS